MTHSGGKPHTNVGDRGQRYEVTVFDENRNERIVIGWSDDPGRAMDMGTAAEFRPSWKFAHVRDRQRRAHLELMTPAERAIYDAIGVVEAAGCDPLLTEAVILLGQARDKVADFVDRPAEGKPEVQK